MLWFFVLSRFLPANRYPLRPKRLWVVWTFGHAGLVGRTVVIPGQAEGLSPEPMNTVPAGRVVREWLRPVWSAVVMGSGLGPRGRPEMAAAVPADPWR
jgi:hypothetical protein